MLGWVAQGEGGAGGWLGFERWSHDDGYPDWESTISKESCPGSFISDAIVAVIMETYRLDMR